MLSTDKTVVTPGWEGRLRAPGLGSVEGVYACLEGGGITRSGTTEVRRLALPAGEGVAVVYLKKYWVTRVGQLWSGALRGALIGRSKARREFENLGQLRAWGLDAPEPVAYGEERRAGWLVRSFLISAGIPEPVPLDALVRDGLPSPTAAGTGGARRTLIQQLAAYTRRLHERRFQHHDYFWRNIILSRSLPGRFFLIDAHKGGCRPAWAWGRARAQDLACLDAPAPRFFRRTERLRFFLGYRGHSRLTGSDKALIRMVLRMAAPQRERQMRRVIEGRRTDG